MDSLQTMEFIQQAIYVALLVCAPPIGAGLGVGILVSVLQTTMSIQEQTLTFVPKILAMALTLAFFGQWMLNILVEYTGNLLMDLPNLVR